MEKVKLQHFVPRFYLQNFTDPAGQIWVFDKATSKRFKSRPESIGAQRYFYDIPELDKESECGQVIEKLLGGIENDAALIIRKWLEAVETNQFRLQQEERILISKFIALQYLRTPEHRKLMIQWAAALQGKTGRTSEKFPAEKEAYITADSLLNSDFVRTIATMLFSHIWHFNRNQTKTPYFTSDHPIALKPGIPNSWRGTGIGTPGIQIFYPLSSSLRLHLLERVHWQKVSRFDGLLWPPSTTVEFVKHDNSCQVLSSTRWIYCRDEDFALAEEMCSKFPDLRDVDRQRITSD